MINSIKNSAVFRNKSAAIVISARAMSAFAYQMLAVAIGWQIYALTKSTFYLGLVGLLQFIPMFLLIIPSGHMADRFNRKMIIAFSQIVEAAAVFVLAYGSHHGWVTKESILALAFLFGATNALQGPSTISLLPNVVHPKTFPKAVALSTSAFQFAVILGPAFGGIFYALGVGVVYSIIGGLLAVTATMILFVKTLTKTIKNKSNSIKELFAGVSFIRSKNAILGAISLDLFAVLLGGATALLPVYASTILKVGPSGLGLLRSAPAAGALIVSAYLARKPLKAKVGHKMFGAVMVFGMATLVFAVSKSFFLSLAALFVLGASDVVSVVIRQTFVQTETPDRLRGRVTSVNQLFIGTSNQLGEFESGVLSSLIGSVVGAVVLGGFGTIVVALTWMKLFPSLLHLNKFKSSEEIQKLNAEQAIIGINENL